MVCHRGMLQCIKGVRTIFNITWNDGDYATTHHNPSETTCLIILPQKQHQVLLCTTMYFRKNTLLFTSKAQYSWYCGYFFVAYFSASKNSLSSTNGNGYFGPGVVWYVQTVTLSNTSKHKEWHRFLLRRYTKVHTMFVITKPNKVLNSIFCKAEWAAIVDGCVTQRICDSQEATLLTLCALLQNWALRNCITTHILYCKNCHKYVISIGEVIRNWKSLSWVKVSNRTALRLRITSLSCSLQTFLLYLDVMKGLFCQYSILSQIHGFCRNYCFAYILRSAVGDSLDEYIALFPYPTYRKCAWYQRRACGPTTIHTE